jgi:hypothetical protein
MSHRHRFFGQLKSRFRLEPLTDELDEYAVYCGPEQVRAVFVCPFLVVFFLNLKIVSRKQPNRTA